MAWRNRSFNGLSHRSVDSNRLDSQTILLRGGHPWGFEVHSDNHRGALIRISKVDPRGRAAKYLKVGDVILRINSVPIYSKEEAVILIDGAFKTLTLSISRGSSDSSSTPPQNIKKRVDETKDSLTREKENQWAQDDSVVYSESKNRGRLKPSRRGESFNLHSNKATRKQEEFERREKAARTSSWQNYNNSQVPQPNEMQSQRHHKPSHGGGRESSGGNRSMSQLNNLIQKHSQPNAYKMSGSKSTSSLGQDNSSGPRMQPLGSWHSVASLSSPTQTASLSTTAPMRYQNTGPSNESSVPSAYPHLGHPSYSHMYPDSRKPHISPTTKERTPSYQSERSASYQDRQQHNPAMQAGGYVPGNYNARSNSYRSDNYENMEHFKSAQNWQQQQPPGASYPPSHYPYGGSNMVQPGAHPHENLPLAGVELERPKPASSPPAPPVRDASSLKYSKLSQSHEKYPSWPVAVANQEESQRPATKYKSPNSRAGSWAGKTNTSEEYPKKPNVVYKPQLNTHSEEKGQPTMKDLIIPQENEPQFRADFLQHTIVANVEGGDGEFSSQKTFQLTAKDPAELQNLYNAQPDYTLFKSEEKDMEVPSPPERDIDSYQGNKFFGEKFKQTQKDPKGRPSDFIHNLPPPPDTSPPPLPNYPPPDTTPTATDPSQDYQVFTIASNSQHASYQYITRTQPFYNTNSQYSTQTDSSTQTTIDRSFVKKSKDSKLVEREELQEQAVVDQNRRESNSSHLDQSRQGSSSSYQDPNRRESSSSYKDPNRRESSSSYKDPNRRESSSSYKDQNRRESGSSYTDPNRRESSSSYKDQMKWESSSYKEHKNGDNLNSSSLHQAKENYPLNNNQIVNEKPEVSPNPSLNSSMNLHEDIHAHLQEHSSESSMIRKLSMEFYGKHQSNPLGGEPGSQSNISANGRLPTVSEHDRNESKDWPSQNKTDHQMDFSRKQNDVSFEEDDEVGDLDASGATPYHLNRKSVANMSLKRAYESPMSQSDGPKGRKNKEARAQVNEPKESHPKTNTKEEKTKPKERHGLKKFFKGPSKMLKRTSSEQVQSPKEKAQESPRDKDSGKKSISSHNLDDESGFVEHGFFPMDKTNDRSPQLRNSRRYSAGSDSVFRNSTSELSPTGLTKSSRSNSFGDNNSKQRRMQEAMRRSITENSTSSMEGTPGENDHNHSRLSGREENDVFKQAKDKSKSLPQSVSLSSINRTGSGDHSNLVTSSESTGNLRSSKSASNVGHHKREGSAPSHLETYRLAPTAIDINARQSSDDDGGFGRRKQKTNSQGVVSRRSTNSSEGTRRSTNSSISGHDSSMDDETHLKAPFEYSPSSSNSPSPGKPISEGQRFRYQVTVNESFKPNEEEESKVPPVLPPRNYRTNMHNRSHSEDQIAMKNQEQRHTRPYMPPPPTTHESKRNSDFENDFGNTPKPDMYAAQLRQMAQKNQSLLAARFQQKPVPETKTSISVSRPVEKQPVPQEAKPPEVQETRQPQPIYRSLQIPQDMNLVGLSNATKNLDPAEPAAENVSVQPDNNSPRFVGSQGPEPQAPPPVQISQSFPVSKHQVVQSVTVPYGARQQSHLLQSGPKNPPQLPPPHNQTEDTSSPPPLPERRVGLNQPRDFNKEIPNQAPELTNYSQNLQEHTETPNRYSSESYLYNKGTVRQGFGGNYKRSDTSPTIPPSTLAFASHNNNSSNTHAKGVPSSPLGSVNPPEMQTMVQVPTVLTSSGHHMESPENHTVLQPGPKLNMEISDRQTQKSINPSYQEPMASSYQEPVQHGRQNNMTYYSEETPKRAPPVSKMEESGVVYQESPGVKAHIAQLESKDSKPNVSDKSMGMSRSKVAELRETLIRRSNENLADDKYCDKSPRRSPHRSPYRSLENLSDNSSHFHHRGSHEDVSRGMENMSISKGRSNEHLFEQRYPQGSTGKTVFDSREQIQNVHPYHHPQQAVEQPKQEESVAYIPRVSPPQSMSDHSYGAKSNDTASNENHSKEQREATPPTGHHKRQKSQEEIECEKQAALLATQLKEREPELSEAILPPPDHKTTNDFMSGIFDTKVNVQRRPSLLQKYQTPEREKQRLERRKTMELKRQEMQLPHNSPYWSPPSIASLQNKMRQENLSTEELLKDMGGTNTSLDRQKEELVNRIQKKIDILKDEKNMLNEEIQENNTLGKEVTMLVETKCTSESDLNKYKLYVAELDKVMYLLLNISGRLARAENAIMSLTEESSETEKTTLISKRDELQSKHEDARMLKDGIDRRSKQVSMNLKKILDEEEFADYEYFIKMKSKLNMEHQEIDDKIKLGEEQLSALKSSLGGL